MASPQVICLKGQRNVLGPSLELAPPNYVYIGRAINMGGWRLPDSKWKNPYTVKQYGRDGALAKYRQYVLSQPNLLQALPELGGKILACWCAPDPCHGYILVELYNQQVLSGVPPLITLIPPAVVQVTPPIDQGLVIYTDGSEVNKYGGWGVVVLRDGQLMGQYYGDVPGFPSTNNRAELYAILAAVTNFQEDMTILSDSEYSIKSLTQYIFAWVKNGWRTTKNRPVENLDLIYPIFQEGQKKTVTFHHVRAHTGVGYNEMADVLAGQGRLNYK